MVLDENRPFPLPGGKQRELAYLVEILIVEFGKLTARRMTLRLKSDQFALAGIRLANLLNASLKPDNSYPKE